MKGILKQRCDMVRLFLRTVYSIKVFPGDSMIKNLPTVQEMQDRSLGGEDPQEELSKMHPVKM